MSSVLEIQEAIERLSAKDKAVLAAWLHSQEKVLMSEAEETALLASLDEGVRQLDAGQGVPLQEVRERVAKWATK